MGIPGRNAPCPCGSGKKYKKCCMEKDMEARNIVKCSLCGREFSKQERNIFESIERAGKRLYFCPECNINLSCKVCKEKFGEKSFDLYSCNDCGVVYVICEECGRQGKTVGEHGC